MDITDRLKEVRKEAGLTQQQFAEAVLLSQSTWAMIECGSRRLTDKNISLICEKFHVNEAWLRDGIGEPHAKQSWEEEVAQFVFSTFQSEEESFQKDLLRVLARLPLDQWEVLGNIAKQLYLEQQKREKEKES